MRKKMQQLSAPKLANVVLLGHCPWVYALQSNNRDHPLQSRLWLDVIGWKERHDVHSKAINKSLVGTAKRTSFPPLSFPGQALSIFQA
jgi:hypothetical protein